MPTKLTNVNTMENSTEQLENLQNYIKGLKKGLDRSIVATPKTREDLENFTNACGGSGTLVAMQMAIQFGYEMALETIEEKL